MPYRIGADPAKHGAADCYSLTRTVMASYGVEMPAPQRAWYRRLRRRDYRVFEDELNLWGRKTDSLDCGVVALCRAENVGFGLAVYWEDGWLNFGESGVRWSPTGALQAVAFYCPLRRTSATRLD